MSTVIRSEVSYLQDYYLFALQEDINVIPLMKIFLQKFMSSSVLFTNHILYTAYSFIYLFTHSIFHEEFKEERRILLEVIGPELQSLYDDRQIEVSGYTNEFINCRIHNHWR